MIVELHNKLGAPQAIEATRVVLRDKIDGVIALVMEVGPRHYYAVHRGDGDVAMNRALRSMGINETVISDMVDEQLPQPQGTLFIPDDDSDDPGTIRRTNG
jgi:hypothetical protein